MLPFFTEESTGAEACGDIRWVATRMLLAQTIAFSSRYGGVVRNNTWRALCAQC